MVQDQDTWLIFFGVTTEMILIRVIASMAIILATASIGQSKDYWLYYLGGQSNMDGFGYTRDLPVELTTAVDNVRIFHGTEGLDGQPVAGVGVWSELRAGHGYGFRSDGVSNQYSDRFGVELTFAKRLRELYPDRPIAILKYSRGGTSIDQRAAGGFGCWEPDFLRGEGAGAGINQYDHFLAAVRNAHAQGDIDGDGEPDRLIPAGILWMQGESDAMYGEEVAGVYQANLKRLMDLIRAALRSDDLPVAIGRISDSARDQAKKTWTHGEIIRQAQADFVANDAKAALVTSTDRYGYSDPWHYDSAGYIDLGKEFANALHSLAE